VARKKAPAKKPAKRPTKKSAKKTAKKSTQPGSLFAPVGKEIWPLERDVLFRPDRLKYVRKLIKPEGCVFCRAASEAASFDTLCVHQTKHSMIVLNKFPYNSGHVLVIPRRHVGDLTGLSRDEYADLHDLLREAVMALRHTYEPGGFNIGLNLGAVGGAGIPEHLHYHVIPRWAGDLNFFPLVAETKTVIENLESTYDRLLAYFKDKAAL
jgi:ATP adenylyltransferase